MFYFPSCCANSAAAEQDQYSTNVIKQFGCNVILSNLKENPCIFTINCDNRTFSFDYFCSSIIEYKFNDLIGYEQYERSEDTIKNFLIIKNNLDAILGSIFEFPILCSKPTPKKRKDYILLLKFKENYEISIVDQDENVISNIIHYIDNVTSAKQPDKRIDTLVNFCIGNEKKIGLIGTCICDYQPYSMTPDLPFSNCIENLPNRKNAKSENG